MHLPPGSLDNVPVAVKQRDELVGEAVLADERQLAGRRVVGQVMIRFDWWQPSFGRRLPRIWRGSGNVAVPVNLELGYGEIIRGCQIAHAWEDPIGRSVPFGSSYISRTDEQQMRHNDAGADERQEAG